MTTGNGLDASWAPGRAPEAGAAPTAGIETPAQASIISVIKRRDAFPAGSRMVRVSRLSILFRRAITSRTARKLVSPFDSRLKTEHHIRIEPVKAGFLSHSRFIHGV